MASTRGAIPVRVNVRTPRKALSDVWAILLPDELSSGSKIQLRIKISDEQLVLRDLSAFLDLIDRMYRRVSREGFASYSHRQYGHLEITKIRNGSRELILDAVISQNSDKAPLLVVIWLAVKYLPPAVHSAASAYHEYEKGRLVRKQRKDIRQALETDGVLDKLPANRKREIVNFLDSLYALEGRKINKAAKFKDRSLIDIDIGPE